MPALPERVVGSKGSFALRHDCFGRRLAKDNVQAIQSIAYRNGFQWLLAPARRLGRPQGHGPDPLDALAEHSNGENTAYVFTPAGLAFTICQSGHCRIGMDHLRSVRIQASQASENKSENTENVESACYGAYGEALVSGDCLHRAFAGWEMDREAGLYNAHARLYSPETRNFLGVDPFLESPSPYPYCEADPFNRIDPSGSISEATIGAIVAGLLLVAGIVITIFTAGAAALAAVGAEIYSDGDFAIAAATYGTVAPAQTGAGATVTQLLPDTVGGFGLGFTSSEVGNGIGFAGQAARGEHVTACQAIKIMLMEPAIAGVSGALGGALASHALLTPGTGLFVRFVFAGSAVANVLSGAASSAMSGQLKQRDTWESIGISMAISVLEAIALTPALARVTPTFFYEGYRPDGQLGFVSTVDFMYEKSPGGQRIRLRDLVDNPDPRVRTRLEDYREYDIYHDKNRVSWGSYPSGTTQGDRYGVRRHRLRDW